jgi:tRNA-dihydrouridine synthase C
VSIPVVANGDLNTVADVQACAAASGCSAFMIGRGAMARPMLFRQLRGESEPDLDLPWLARLMLRYADDLLQSGASPGAALGRLKQWLRLAAPAFDELHALFDRVKRMHSLTDAQAALLALEHGSASAA